MTKLSVDHAIRLWNEPGVRAQDELYPAGRLLAEEVVRLRAKLKEVRDTLVNIGDGEALDVLDKEISSPDEPT